ncbi:MAG: hypothetical protein IJ121_10660 [Eubacterium sp.]|nr:hypothetical protein [Eubacterium sp.]
MTKAKRYLKSLSWVCFLVILIISSYPVLAESVPAASSETSSTGNIQNTYKTGLYKVDGTLKYYENGEFKRVTGVVKKPSNGKLYYVKDGIYTKKFTGVAQLINTKKRYVVHKGKVDLKANGLICAEEYSNGWYIPRMVLYKVKKGKLTGKAALPKVSKSVKGADKNTQARNVAKKIVKKIIGYNKEQKIEQAAKIVSIYSSKARYTMKGKDYSTAYGVFVKGEYSCAGSTRALGMLLDLMGYKWKHVNENQYKHQWVELKIKGKKAWADGQVGEIGYGKRF